MSVELRPIVCTFCGAESSQSTVLILKKLPTINVLICNSCVDIAASQVSEWRAKKAIETPNQADGVPPDADAPTSRS